MGATQNLFFVIGMLIAFVFNYAIAKITRDSSGHSYWQIVFALPLLTTALQQLFFLTHYSHGTPKYELIMGKHNEARLII